MPLTYNYKTYIEIGCYLLLIFFVIPIKIDKEYEVLQEEYEKYLKDFNKSYPDKETYNLRLKAFKNSLENIKILNSNKTNNSAQYGLTKFSDMTPEEFFKFHLSNPLTNRALETVEGNPFKKKRSYWKGLPKKIDWREKNAVTKIQNQKHCGACWAFAVTQTIESMKAIKSNQLKELSVQEMIDCTIYNNGCNGGDVCSLLRWLKDYNVSVVSAEEYPLVLTEQKCKKADLHNGVQIQDFTCASLVGVEDIILELIAKYGPVAVAINGQTWQNYVGGIIQFHCDGKPTDLNHAVQIVGYDLTGEIPYYIVRNSWGEDFGDNGYMYIAVGYNMCGLAYEVSALTVL